MDRDDELGDSAQDLEEFGFCGFQEWSSPEQALATRARFSEQKRSLALSIFAT